MLSDTDTLAWIALSLTNISFNKADLQQLENPSRFVDKAGWNFSELKNKIKASHYDKLLEKLQLTKIFDYQKYVNYLIDNEINLISFSNKQYPRSLKEINNPPLLLCKKGNLNDLNNGIAIVGRRNCTHYARSMARDIAQELSENFIINSGLARGIDYEAHCGALDKGNPTVAVLAGPVTKIYPPEFEDFALDIIKNGAILSERIFHDNSKQSSYLFGKAGFILRNRIVSGISKAIIVIETTSKSGTMSTINYALKQKKPIFILEPNKKEGEVYLGYKETIKKGVKTFRDISELNTKINELIINKKSKTSKNTSLDNFIKSK